MVTVSGFISSAEEWADRLNVFCRSRSVSSVVAEFRKFGQFDGMVIDRCACDFSMNGALLVSKNHWIVLRWTADKGWFVVTA